VFVNGGQAWPPLDGPRGTFLRPAPSK
jgi:hypothetical protein